MRIVALDCRHRAKRIGKNRSHISTFNTTTFCNLLQLSGYRKRKESPQPSASNILDLAADRQAEVLLMDINNHNKSSAASGFMSGIVQQLVGCKERAGFAHNLQASTPDGLTRDIHTHVTCDQGKATVISDVTSRQESYIRPTIITP